MLGTLAEGSLAVSHISSNMSGAAAGITAKTGGSSLGTASASMCNCNSLVVVSLSLKASLPSFLLFLTTDRSSFSTMLWADRPLINALSILWTSFILFCNSDKAELWSSLRAGSFTSLLSISIASASWQFQKNTQNTRAGRKAPINILGKTAAIQSHHLLRADSWTFLGSWNKVPMASRSWYKNIIFFSQYVLPKKSTQTWVIWLVHIFARSANLSLLNSPGLKTPKNFHKKFQTHQPLASAFSGEFPWQDLSLILMGWKWWGPKTPNRIHPYRIKWGILASYFFEDRLARKKQNHCLGNEISLGCFDPIFKKETNH